MRVRRDRLVGPFEHRHIGDMIRIEKDAALAAVELLERFPELNQGYARHRERTLAKITELEQEVTILRDRIKDVEMELIRAEK